MSDDEIEKKNQFHKKTSKKKNQVNSGWLD
jgi:hypothetical protein